MASLDHFTCQLLTHQDQLQQLMSAIASRQYLVGVEEGLQLQPSLPVCACSAEREVWQRGLVMSTGELPNTYTVLYVDYGGTEILPAERIKPLEECFITSLPPQSVKCSLPVLLESDVNLDLPSAWDVWELSWPTACISHFRKLTGAAQDDSAAASVFSMEPIAVNEDGTYVVKLCDGELDIRDALIANLRDPGCCVIKDPTPTSKDVEEEGGSGFVEKYLHEEVLLSDESIIMPQQEGVSGMDVSPGSEKREGPAGLVLKSEVSSA